MRADARATPREPPDGLRAVQAAAFWRARPVLFVSRDWQFVRMGLAARAVASEGARPGQRWVTRRASMTLPRRRTVHRRGRWPPGRSWGEGSGRGGKGTAADDAEP